MMIMSPSLKPKRDGLEKRNKEIKLNYLFDIDMIKSTKNNNN